MKLVISVVREEHADLAYSPTRAVVGVPSLPGWRVVIERLPDNAVAIEVDDHAR